MFRCLYFRCLYTFLFLSFSFLYPDFEDKGYVFSPNYENFLGLSNEELDVYISDFLNNVYFDEISQNTGGMHVEDMFTLYLTLKMVNPTLVVESGVWTGLSAKVIRKTLGGNCKIICLDPKDSILPEHRDTNQNTIYYVGDHFIDFSEINLKEYGEQKILAFFDDHITAPQRVLEAKEKKIKHLIFNDNILEESCLHLEHLIQAEKHPRHQFDANDISYFRDRVLPLIKYYNKFPNFFADGPTFWGRRALERGYFNTNSKDKYRLFYEQKVWYSANTYVELK